MKPASLVVAAVAFAAPVHAQPAGPGDPERPAERDPRESPVMKPAHKPREIVIDVPGERSSTNRITLAATLGVGVLAGAIGAYYHVESRDAAEAVSAVELLGQAWTHEEVALVDEAERAGRRAGIAYAIGGAFVIGTIVAFIVTAPDAERTVIRTGASASLVPGGAMALGTWSF